MRKRFKLFHCAIILLVHLHLVHPAIRDEEINIGSFFERESLSPLGINLEFFTFSAAIFQSANVYNPSLAGFEDGVRHANSFVSQPS